MMKQLATSLLSGVLIAAPLALSAGPADGGADPRTWSFDGDPADKAPSGFSFGRTGEGKPGRWVVRADKDAPSARAVLAQVDTDETDYRFPVAVANAPEFKDLRLAVKCKPVEGKVDQACGLVFRYKDENNYYVTRANALENNVRLYHVKDGRRIQFAGWNGKVAKNTWHALAVEALGSHFVVSFDGKKVIEATDGTFPGPGKVGVWTKADSVTLFDDLTATPLK